MGHGEGSCQMGKPLEVYKRGTCTLILISDFKSSLCGEQIVGDKNNRESLGVCYRSAGLKSMLAYIRDLVVEVKVSEWTGGTFWRTC